MSTSKVTSAAKFVFVSAALAQGGKMMTVGEVEKAIAFMTKSQCQRVLDELVYEGWAFMEVRAHGRTGKKVYGLTEHFAIECAHIATSYNSSVVNYHK